MHDKRDDRCTTATTTMNTGERRISTTVMPVSGNEDDETLITLSSATTSSTPTSQFILSPLSVPIQFAEINTSPPTTDDCMIFNDVDISTRFYSFKQDVNNRIQQQLLALSSILLLKLARTHATDAKISNKQKAISSHYSH